MSDDGFALTRRDWLVTGGIALGGLALPQPPVARKPLCIRLARDCRSMKILSVLRLSRSQRFEISWARSAATLTTEETL
jgi:hypothetical protein